MNDDTFTYILSVEATILQESKEKEKKTRREETKRKNPIGGKTLKGENFSKSFGSVRFGTVRFALVWLGLVLLIISRLCLFFCFFFCIHDQVPWLVYKSYFAQQFEAFNREDDRLTII